MTPTTYGRDFAYCLKSHGGVRGFNASLWRFLLRCTLFCHSVATFLTSVSSYEGGCGFEVKNEKVCRRYISLEKNAYLCSMKYNQEDRMIIREFPNSFFALGYFQEIACHRLQKEWRKLVSPILLSISKLIG